LYFQTSLNLPLSPLISAVPEDELAQTSSSQIAIALTIMEAEKYRCILAGECVAHLCQAHPGISNVQDALDLNIRITNWVIWSILQPEHYKVRADVMRAFVKTAEVSRLPLLCDGTTLSFSWIGMSEYPKFLVLVRHRQGPKIRKHHLSQVDQWLSVTKKAAFVGSFKQFGSTRQCIPSDLTEYQRQTLCPMAS
jgi:hypothetical protein